MPQVMVISSEGFFYLYNIDLENGGECTLMKQYRQVICCSDPDPTIKYHPSVCWIQVTKAVVDLANS